MRLTDYAPRGFLSPPRATSGPVGIAALCVTTALSACMDSPITPTAPDGVSPTLSTAPASVRTTTSAERQ